MNGGWHVGCQIVGAGHSGNNLANHPKIEKVTCWTQKLQHKITIVGLRLKKTFLRNCIYNSPNSAQHPWSQRDFAPGQHCATSAQRRTLSCSTKSKFQLLHWTNGVQTNTHSIWVVDRTIVADFLTLFLVTRKDGAIIWLLSPIKLQIVVVNDKYAASACKTSHCGCYTEVWPKHTWQKHSMSIQYSREYIETSTRNGRNFFAIQKGCNYHQQTTRMAVKLVGAQLTTGSVNQ